MSDDDEGEDYECESDVSSECDEYEHWMEFNDHDDECHYNYSGFCACLNQDYSYCLKSSCLPSELFDASESDHEIEPCEMDEERKLKRKRTGDESNDSKRQKI